MLYDLLQIPFLIVIILMRSNILQALTWSKYLLEPKVMYSSEDVINPMCWCGTDVKSVTHFFLHFSPNFLIKEAATAGVL